MRVLQLISSAGYYGAENMLVNLASALEENGCRAVVGAFHHPAGPEPDILRFARERGLETWAFPCDGRLDRASVRRLRDYLTANGFDVLHTHGYKANLYGWLAARGLRLGPVATCHNWPNRKGLLAVYATLDRLVLRRFAKVFAVSEGVMELLAQFGIRPPKSQVINNGIDTARFDGSAGGLRSELGLGANPVVGTVTRLVPGKGVDVLLEAFPAVLKKHPEAKLVVVGAGPLDGELREQAARLGLRDSVIFTGARGDMPAVYAALDVFVLASFDEGMPMTVLEAMSSGCRVVATRVGAIPRLLRDGENGRLIAPRDAGAVSEAILDALARPGLGPAARHTIVRDFSSAAMARQYLAHYAALGRLKKVAV